MGSTRRSFTAEYKKAAVEFVLDGGRSIADVAKSIGVSSTSLGHWVQKEKESRGADERPLSLGERAELESLRAENRRLKMEAEFAKKVAAWFANDQR
jgi:transposase